jgi:hypothetical protein
VPVLHCEFHSEHPDWSLRPAQEEFRKPALPNAHELDCAAGNNERFKAICAQKSQQLQLRLINEFGVRAMQRRVSLLRKPITYSLVVVVDGHPAVRDGDQFQQLLSPGPQVPHSFSQSTLCRRRRFSTPDEQEPLPLPDRT